MNYLNKSSDIMQLIKLTHPIKRTGTSNSCSILQFLSLSRRPSKLDFSAQASSNLKTAHENQDLIALLRSDLKHSMKVKDLTQRDVIKSLLGDLQNSQHTKNPRSHEKVIDQAIKKRVEAAKISLESIPPRVEINRENLNEVEILKKYASFLSSNRPTESFNQMELMKIVDHSIQTLGASVDDSLQERQNSLGKIIKSVKEQVDCKFDGKQIADAVKKTLQLP